MKISEAKAQKINAWNITKLTDAQLLDLHTNVRRSIEQRRHAFERAGIESEFKYKQPLKSAGELLKAELGSKAAKQAAKQARGGKSALPGNIREQLESEVIGFIPWTAGKPSTVKGMQEIIEQERRELIDRFNLKHEPTWQEIQQYRRFMNSMAKRYGSKWKKYSAEAWKMAQEAFRLNINPEQFLRNFDYWREHLEDLENVKDSEVIKKRRGGKVTPGEYRKKLGLENIYDWNKRNK